MLLRKVILCLHAPVYGSRGRRVIWYFHPIGPHIDAFAARIRVVWLHLVHPIMCPSVQRVFGIRYVPPPQTSPLFDTYPPSKTKQNKTKQPIHPPTQPHSFAPKDEASCYDDNQYSSRHLLCKCVYQIWRLYIIVQAINEENYFEPFLAVK